MTPRIPTKPTLKEGRYYVRRDGRRVGPARLTASLFYPFAAGPDTYSKDGKFCLGIEAHALDLISEVPANRIAPAAKARKVQSDRSLNAWAFVCRANGKYIVDADTGRMPLYDRQVDAKWARAQCKDYRTISIVRITLPSPKKASKP